MFSSALGIMAEAAVVVIGLYIGLRSARSLMKTFDDVEAEPAPTTAPAEAPA